MLSVSCHPRSTISTEIAVVPVPSHFIPFHPVVCYVYPCFPIAAGSRQYSHRRHRAQLCSSIRAANAVHNNTCTAALANSSVSVESQYAPQVSHCPLAHCFASTHATARERSSTDRPPSQQVISPAVTASYDTRCRSATLLSVHQVRLRMMLCMYTQDVCI